MNYEHKNGVGWYTSGAAHVEIHFPEDKVCCANCVPFCRYEEAFKRYSCRATGEQLLYPFATIGAMCPIQFNKTKEETEQWH